MEIFGNKRSICRLRELTRLECNTRIVVISGKSNIGKSSAALSVLQDCIEDSDLKVIGSGISEVRLASEFLMMEPLFSSFRAVVVNNACSMSEPAHDALLKLCENPPSSCRIWFITNDYYSMLPALRSRIQEVVRFETLNNEDMIQFIESNNYNVDDFGLTVSSGRPGIFIEIANNPRFTELMSFVSNMISGSLDVSDPIPDAISSLDWKPGIARTAVAEVCRNIALKSVAFEELRSNIIIMLRFADTLQRYPSVNAEVHWKNASICCSL